MSCGRLRDCAAYVDTFPGGFVGGVRDGCRFWLTRLPEFTRKSEWVEWDGDRWRLNVRHVTNSVELPNLTDGGVEYTCVSVAGSQYGDGTWKKERGDGVVWFQTNWVPVDDPETLTPRAGLAIVKVYDEAQQETDPDNSEFTLVSSWLLASDYRWDNRRKLAYHYENSTTAYKTVCGPEQFGIVKRVRGGNCELTYWDGGDPVAKVRIWSNPETTETTGDWPSIWLPVFFSRHTFPMALFQQNKVTYHTGGGIATYDTRWRMGRANLSTMQVVDELEANASDYKVGASPVNCQRNNDAVSIDLNDCRTFTVDWECGGWWKFLEDNNDPPQQIPIRSYPETYGGGTDIGSAYDHFGMGIFTVPIEVNGSGTPISANGFNLQSGDPAPRRMVNVPYEQNSYGPRHEAGDAIWDADIEAPSGVLRAHTRIFWNAAAFYEFNANKQIVADTATPNPYKTESRAGGTHAEGDVNFWTTGGVTRVPSRANVQFASINVNAYPGGASEAIGEMPFVIQRFPSPLSAGDTPINIPTDPHKTLADTAFYGGADGTLWHNEAFPDNQQPLTTIDDRAAEYWIVHDQQVIPLYSDWQGDGLHPAAYPVGDWSDGSEWHADGFLAWDGSLDDDHPTKGEAAV
jgi:hypothetical protein